ncbi:glycosyltransferase family A protein [soil metagenome]|jgi:cellulose synthase/poly-beta-1,6-N-acetylglucosamine synthase-like glycosyltransferase
MSLPVQLTSLPGPFTDSRAATVTAFGSDRASTTRQIGVVIPVHNEEDLLAACLHSVAAAAAQVTVPVQIVVALDRCTDRSADIVRASRTGALLVESSTPGVGAARAAGNQAILDRYGVDQVWLAGTDADSTVSPDWLRRQLRHAAAGADVVIGTIDVLDWESHSMAVQSSHAFNYHRGNGHRHIHGANLAMTARAYLAAGGFDSLLVDEDVELIAAMQATGQRLVWAGDLPVATSARAQGRAIGGFADHLQQLGNRTAVLDAS